MVVEPSWVMEGLRIPAGHWAGSGEGEVWVLRGQAGGVMIIAGPANNTVERLGKRSR